MLLSLAVLKTVTVPVLFTALEFCIYYLLVCTFHDQPVHHSNTTLYDHSVLHTTTAHHDHQGSTSLKDESHDALVSIIHDTAWPKPSFYAKLHDQLVILSYTTSYDQLSLPSSRHFITGKPSLLHEPHGHPDSVSKSKYLNGVSCLVWQSHYCVTRKTFLGLV